MTNPAPAVTAETLSLIAYQNVPVLTTELLATLYGTDQNNIAQNFARNAERFEPGKHYFKLEGEALKEFKRLNCMTDSHVVQISKHAKHLFLWTHRGAARHAKILDTDQAWDVFERLEDAYFARTTAAAPPPAQPEEEVLVTISGSWKTYALFLEVKTGHCYRALPPQAARAASKPVAAAKPAAKRRGPMTAAEHAWVQVLCGKGLSPSAIAKEIGRDAQCVRRSLGRAQEAAQ